MIEIAGLTKIYYSHSKETYAVGGVDLTVREGEFVSIVGPSGCGKSTILNMVASFLTPTSGSLKVMGEPVVPGKIPGGLGYIFQKDTVLPWFNVARNIGLGLRFKGLSQSEIDAKVQGLLDLAHLTGCQNMYPHQLSGGMKQRVALLMTLACEPKILLLDEPFGALDSNTKMILHKELLDIWGQLGQTIMMVTHDLDEAISLSDRVIVLSAPPSKVVLDHRVMLERPRDVFSLRQSPRFGEQVREVWAVLGQEYQMLKAEEV